MADNTNPIDRALSGGAEPTSPAPAASSSPTPSAPNPIDAALQQSSAPAPTTTGPTPSAFENPIDAALSGSTPSAASPENGQPEPDYKNPNQSLVKRAWEFANTPITESLFGLPTDRAGAGGFERAGEHIVSGFTSPLSIALTLATFGTGGFLESAGASALKEAGLSAAEVADVAKGAEVMGQAAKTGQNYAQAVTNAGLDFNKVKSGLDLLYSSGLKEPDLIGGNAVERGTSILFRKYGLTPSQAQTAAKTLQTAANAGFSYQQIQQAAAMSPRALDALKDGDYDHFVEYGTEALAGGLLGAAGAAHTIHSAGDLASPILGQKLRPSDESRAFSQLFDARDGQHQRANEQARLLEQNSMKTLGYKDPENPFTSEGTAQIQNDRLAQIYHGITLGFDKNLAAEHYNAIAEAAGRDDRLPVVRPEGPIPENGQPVQNPALPANLQDLIQNSALKNKPASYIDHLLDTYKGVYDGFTDTEMGVAKNIRALMDQGFQDANANGLIGHQVENYMRRVWKKENPSANRVINDAKTGRFTTNVSMARQRVYQTELEPLLKGHDYATENAVGIASQWLSDTYKAIANKKLLGAVMDRGIKGSDGRPAAVLLGNGQVVEGSGGENPVTLVRPDAVRNINIADPVIDQLKSTGELDRFLDNGTIADLTPKVYPDTLGTAIARLEQKAQGANPQYDPEGNNVLRQKIQFLKDVQSGKRPASDLADYNAALKPIYVWRPQDYIHLDQPSMRQWNFVTHDPSGDPVLVRSDVAVHPEYAEYLKTRLGLDESALQKWAPTRMLLKGGGEAKKLLLSFSPFHLLQEGMRGVMMGVNPISLKAPSIEESPVLGKMVDNGLTLEPDYKALQEHSEGVAGHSKILDKLPFGIGKSMTWYQDFLFKRYIPSLKARAGESMFEQYKAKHPDWTDDRVAEVAASHVNDTFGGLAWKKLGVSATQQDWYRIMSLAPDWLASEMRSAGRLFNRDYGDISRAQMAKITLGLWGVARVLNLLTTGKPHFEAPFSLVVKDKDGKQIDYSMRTLPTDILHAATDPVGFIKGRLSPAVRTGQELLSSRDQFGRKLTPGDLSVDLFRNLEPIPFQAVGQAVSGTGPQVGNPGQVVKALGGTATVYRTEAQRMAAQIASDHSEDGPVDPALLRRHQAIMRIEDNVRSGQMSLPQIWQMTVQGALPETDAKKITENLKNTKGMPADLASLYTRASRLPGPDLLKVWALATNQEKQVLTPLIVKARRNYIKKAMKDETPQERMTDPVLKQYMALMPHASPF